MRNLIYGLIDPRTRMIRYVGQSSQGLKRAREHRCDPVRFPTLYVSRWVAALRRNGLEFEIVVLDICERTQLDALEKHWIAFGTACGWPLTNLTRGGRGPSGRPKTAPELRRIRAAKLGDKNPSKRPEVRARIQATLRTMWSDPAYRRQTQARMQAGRVGLSNPMLRPDVRERQRAAIKIAMNRPEVRAKNSASKRGNNNPMKRPEVVAKRAATLAAKRLLPVGRLPAPPT